MTEVIKFETPYMMAQRLARENKAGLHESSGKMKDIIDNPDKSERTKLEAQMAKAIFKGDDKEMLRIGSILERLNTTGIDIVK
jgi:hypothetical protein